MPIQKTGRRRDGWAAFVLPWAVSISMASTVWAAEPGPAAQQEISHLLSYLQRSGCQFNRNGTWYSSGEAVAHLGKKLDYLRGKGWVSTAEDFIGRAATESSFSGKPYQVKCGAHEPVPSAVWLKEELLRHRTASNRPAAVSRP